MAEDLTDAKLATAEARTDAKFAELIGRYDTRFAEMIGRSDKQFEELRGDIRVVQSSTSGLKSTIVVTGVALFLGLAALLVGVLAYGSGAFYNGTVIRDMLNKQAASVGSNTQ